MPSLPASFGLAPAASKSFAESMSPLRAAKRSGVKAIDEAALTSAFASMSSLTMSTRRSPTAHMSGVCCDLTVLASTFAPRARSALTIGALPVRDAIISGVTPLPCAAFTLARAASSVSTSPASAFSQASDRGVTP